MELVKRVSAFESSRNFSDVIAEKRRQQVKNIKSIKLREETQRLCFGYGVIKITQKKARVYRVIRYIHLHALFFQRDKWLWSRKKWKEL